jgi:hypothetical protein
MNVSGEIPGKVDHFSLSPHYSKHSLEVKLKFIYFWPRQIVLFLFLYNSTAFSNNMDLKTIQELRKHLKRTSEGVGSKSVWRQWIVFIRCRPKAFYMLVRKCPLKNVRNIHEVFINKKEILVEYVAVHGQFADDLTRGELSKLKYDLPDHSNPQQGMIG